MQIQKELALIRPDVSAKDSEDKIHQVLCEVVATCTAQKATAQAWQSKFQTAAFDLDRLTGDLKRAQVYPLINLIATSSCMCLRGDFVRAEIRGWSHDIQTLQAEIARLKERDFLATAEDAE